MADPLTQFWVYRLFSATGDLLYVGYTCDPRARMNSHASTKTWWPEVASNTFIQYGTRSEALAEEKRAVRDEGPRYNIQLRGRSKAGVKRDASGWTKVRAFRMDDPLYSEVKAFAESRNETVTDLIHEALIAYLDTSRSEGIAS
jgi:excinuclease UvrABC nuclease subunit